MSETLAKLDNFSKTVRACARIVLHGHSRRRARIENEMFCGNKTSTGMEILQLIFAKVVD